MQTRILRFKQITTEPGGNRLPCRIAVVFIDRRVACHFRRRHPGDSMEQRPVFAKKMRVAAGNMLQICRPIHADRIRGPAQMTPATVRLTGRGVATVPVCLLVPQVKPAKRLDLGRDAARAHEAVPGLIAAPRAQSRFRVFPAIRTWRAGSCNARAGYFPAPSCATPRRRGPGAPSAARETPGGRAARLRRPGRPQTGETAPWICSGPSTLPSLSASTSPS